MTTRKLICSMFALGLATAALSSPSYAIQCDSCPPEFGGMPRDGYRDQQGEKADRPKNPRKEKEMEKKAEKKPGKVERYKPGTVMRYNKCYGPLKVNC